MQIGEGLLGRAIYNKDTDRVHPHHFPPLRSAPRTLPLGGVLLPYGPLDLLQEWMLKVDEWFKGPYRGFAQY
jgi:hypothetical protein